MFAKIQQEKSQSQFLAGCFIVNNQHQPHISSDRSLPLRKINYQIDITNGLAEVNLVQQFENITEKFLEIVYQFPISPSVCIHRFSATFAKSRMEGIVKQKEEAQKQYSQAYNQGKRAAYGNFDPQNEDIMILKIGNIGPKQKATIQISYIEQLSLSLNTFYKFTLPVKYSPRFMNKMSQQQFFNSFQKKALIQGGQFQWDFKMNLKSSKKILAYQSTSHQLSSNFKNDTMTEISLTFAEAQTFYKDFVFFYTTSEFQIPSYTIGKTDKGSTVMVSFIPKFCSLNLQDAKKEALQANNFEADMDSVKGEYIFLLDRSGSMGGTRIKKAKQALILFLKSLPIDSYFNVGSFGSNYNFIYQSSRKCTTLTIQDAIKKVQKMDANMGGTYIQQPLQKIFNSKIIEGYPKLIYFLTDGEVDDTKEVIDLVRKNVKYSRVNAIGIGAEASQALIKGCAQKGKGHYTFIYNNQNPSEKIIQLLNDSLSAVISKVQLNYDKDLVQSIVPNPNSMPYILKGQVVNFYITFKNHLQKSTFVSLSYEDSQNKLPFKSQISIDPESLSYPFIDIMGHYKYIKALQQAQQDKVDSLYCVKQFQSKAKIIELSKKYNILSKYTSFICVEKEILDGKYQEVKSKGQIAIEIAKNNQPKPYGTSSIPLSSSFAQTHSYITFSSSLPSPLPPPPPIPSLTTPLPIPPPPISSVPLPSPTPSFSSSPSNLLLSNMGFPSILRAIPPPPPTIDSIPQSNLFASSVPPPPTIGSIPQSNLFEYSAPRNFSSHHQYQSAFDLNLENIVDLGQDFFSEQKGNAKGQKKSQNPFAFFEQQINYSSSNKQFFGSNLIELQNDVKPNVSTPVNNYNVDEVIKQQQFQGQWLNLKLIEKLFGKQLAQSIRNRIDLAAVITFLILKWFEKHHPEKQYQLITKKAANWLKKHSNKDYSEQFKASLI